MAAGSHQILRKHAPDRLLVRGVNWLGDAVMTTPALARLREQLPRTEISLLVPSKLEPLFQGHASIDRVISFPPSQSLLATAQVLRRYEFDAALILPASHRSALECFLAGIPLRIGLAHPGRQLLLTRSIDPRTSQLRMRKLSVRQIRERITGGLVERLGSASEESHQIYDYLHLVTESFGGNQKAQAPRLVVEQAEVEMVLRKFGLDSSESFVGLNPGAEYGPAKRWPKENFIAAALQVARTFKGKFLLFGLKGDMPICDAISSSIDSIHGSRAINLAGKSSLRELMALVKACRVLLTNDSGPMHLASALGTPVVALFGSTSPELTGPLPADAHSVLRGEAPCSPCFLRQCPIDFRCMRSIMPQVAAEKVLRHLATAVRNNS